MSMLAPLSSSPFTRAKLVDVLQSGAMTGAIPHLLRWLVWLPLLSVEELTRLERARLEPLEQTRSPQRVAAQLLELEQRLLVTHVMANEPGWPPHEHRYYLTDAGLYVFAAQTDPPLSVPRLAQAYAVQRVDVLKRIAQSEKHMALTSFATRLIAEGQKLGYPLTSYQQPWTQRDTLFGHQRTLQRDAAFLLAHPQGTEHAFYVHIDIDDRRPLALGRERLSLQHLLTLRHVFHLEHETMPSLLILSTPARLHLWAALLEATSVQLGTALLEGAITTLDILRQAGAFGPIWWSFPEIVQWTPGRTAPEPGTRLIHLLGHPVSPLLAEHFSQRSTFAHLYTTRKSGPLRRTSRPLSSYVGKPLTSELPLLRAEMLADALKGTRNEQLEALALLNLALSAMQKQLLFWLTHHPLLTAHHLAALHHPGARSIRGVHEQMRDLFQRGLLVSFHWTKAIHWHERERYLASEAGLRYIALREERPVTAYLLPDPYKKPERSPQLNIQLGTAGLVAQMHHTHGLYTCMVQLHENAHRDHIQIIAWRNAHESIDAYTDPITHANIQIRPDATLIYQLPGESTPRHLLIEYDRATVTAREHQAKYLTYANYRAFGERVLPPILVITQHEQSAALIRECIHGVARDLHIMIVLEEQLAQMRVYNGTEK